MSRIGEQPIQIPVGVTIKIDGSKVKVVGPKGSLFLKVRQEIRVKLKNGQLIVSRLADNKMNRALHGLTRALIANMVVGVTEGFIKVLKLVGTGYRVKFDPPVGGKKLVFSLGFSHPVVVEPVAGIEFEIEDNDRIKIMGIDKALVGQVAAKIRAIRPPDPYKGKGIRYQDEEVKLKPGKAAVSLGGEQS